MVDGSGGYYYFHHRVFFKRGSVPHGAPFFGVAETLQKRLCHASYTPQKHSGSHPHLHLYSCMRSAIVVGFMASEQGVVRLMRAPSSVLRPDSAPELGACCLKNNFLTTLRQHSVRYGRINHNSYTIHTHTRRVTVIIALQPSSPRFG